MCNLLDHKIYSCLCFLKPLPNYFPRILIRNNIILSAKTITSFLKFQWLLNRFHGKWLIRESGGRIFGRIPWKINTKERSEALLKMNLFLEIFQKFPKITFQSFFKLTLPIACDDLSSQHTVDILFTFFASVF